MRNITVVPTLAVWAISGCASLVSPPQRSYCELLAEGGEAPAGSLVLTFFEVGIGDAMLVEMPDGRNLLIDAGIGWMSNHILSYLEARGIRRLDGLLLTHPHLDHFGGMERVVERMEVGRFYHNGVRNRSQAYRRLEEALDARGVPHTVLRRGDSLPEICSAGVSLDVLYPEEEDVRHRNYNRGTLVLSLTHGSVKVLLAGDAEEPEEERLLALEGDGLAHQVLKLGHHSSPGSGTPEFLEAVRPSVAIAMGTEVVNVPILYPRPNPVIRRVLGEMGAEILTTDQHGTFQLISDGAGWRLRGLESPRRWPAPDPRDLAAKRAAPHRPLASAAPAKKHAIPSAF